MKQASSPPADFVRHQCRVAGWVFLVLVAIFGGLIARLVYVNTAMAPRLHAMASLQQESRTPVPARRGSILDVRGRVLAGSRQCYSVFADPSLIDNPTDVANVLAPILEIEPGPLEDAIRSSDAPRFCWLKRKVDDAAAEAVRKLRLSGVGLRSEFERHWPMGRAAAQVLGIVGSDDRGLEGLELVYDRFLRGTPGRRSVLRDARRRALGAGRVAAVEPHDGGHLVLTIDAVIQEQVERRLAEQVEAFGAESGVAVVMSPRTGDVLALANVPTFDPSDYGAFDQDTRRNRVITDPVEPGSTFKPFIAAGALAGGWVNTTERIDCHKGLFYFGSRRMHDTKPHGLMDLREIVVYSSNIGMGILGTRMGNDALYEVIARMGFGSRTQIGLRGESPGILLPLPKWNSYSTTSVTMGQELAVTPIQLTNAFCALVNGGYLLRPRCVKARLNADYTPQESFEGPEIIRRVLDENLSRYMREDVMPGVVARGGKELAVGEYTMCGKTGTAQVPYKNSPGYEPNMYLSSFIGAAPVHDPKIVVLVMIRKPDRTRGYYGRVVAGPVVRDIVRATLSYLNVPPTKMLASTGL